MEPEPTREDPATMRREAGHDAQDDRENVQTNSDEPAASAEDVLPKNVFLDAPVPSGPGLETGGLPEGLLAALEPRQSFYSQLADLAEERKLFRLQGSLSTEAEAELLRQEAELENMPEPEEADFLIAQLRERRKDREDEPRLPETSRRTLSDQQLRKAEELAESQWLRIRNSGRDALSAIAEEAYPILADEPFARELSGTGIEHRYFLGLAAYHLALEALFDKAERERRSLLSQMQSLDDGTAGGDQAGVLAKIGKLASDIANRGKNREHATRLSSQEERMRDKIGELGREMAYVRKILIRGFWPFYTEVALSYVPRPEAMPLPIRAFLRYGAIGFGPLWMNGGIRERITRDCGEGAVRVEAGQKHTHVLYADEYLDAVARRECSPAPDEETTAERGSPKWKAERAFRRIVNSRSYAALLEETLHALSSRIGRLDENLARQSEKIADISSRTFASKDALPDLESKMEIQSARKANLLKHAKRLEEELLPAIREAAEEYETRFLSGELEYPDVETLLRRECRSMAEAAARISGKRSYFIPFALRERTLPDEREMLNDRDSVRAAVLDIEKRDPGIFQQTLVPSRKKHNRIDLRMSPVIVILPSAGVRGSCLTPREGMESGHLALPVCFAKEHVRDGQMINLFADFRWESSKKMAGLDVMTSDTLAGAFMKLRWEWRNQPREKREKALIFNELSDQANWRRIYELYMTDSMEGGRRLFARNPECYNAIIGTYIDLPEGVAPLKP